jgi:hypothetical protein
MAMYGRIMVIALMMLFATAAEDSDAKVLSTEYTVSEEPLTVVAIASAYKPRRVALDVVPRPSAPVRVEWIVLCWDGSGPTTGGSFVTERPTHRRVELPPRPWGLCHLEAEAAFVDPDQAGRIAVTFRGRVREAPGPLP